MICQPEFIRVTEQSTRCVTFHNVNNSVAVHVLHPPEQYATGPTERLLFTCNLFLRISITVPRTQQVFVFGLSYSSHREAIIINKKCAGNSSIVWIRWRKTMNRIKSVFVWRPAVLWLRLLNQSRYLWLNHWVFKTSNASMDTVAKSSVCHWDKNAK